MANIQIDNVLMSSAFPGFGYSSTPTGSIVVSGSVPDIVGRTYSTSMPVDSTSFVAGYYSILGSDILYTITGSGHGSAVVGVGNTTHIYGRQVGNDYIVDVVVDNFTGSSQTVPTQTVNIRLYTFTSPFS